MRGGVNIIQSESLRGDVNKGIYECYVSKISLYSFSISEIKAGKPDVRQTTQHKVFIAWKIQSSPLQPGWLTGHHCANEQRGTDVFYRLSKHVCTRNTHLMRRRNARTHFWMPLDFPACSLLPPAWLVSSRSLSYAVTVVFDIFIY